MKKVFDPNADLSRFNGRTILEHSKLQNRLSNDEIAKFMGLGEETVSRYLREPHEGEREYGLPIRRVALWNRAVGNDVVIKWLCQDCGGMFIRVDGDSPADMNLTVQMRKVNKEASDATGAFLRAMENGLVEDRERPEIVKELIELRSRVEAALLVAENKCTNKQ